VQESQRLSIEIFPILGQSAAAAKPRQCSFNNPTLRKNLEAFHRIRALDDFRHQAWQGFLLRLAKFWSLVAAIGEQFLKKWKFPKQRAQDENAAIAILDIGAMNDRMKQQAYRVDENMPLLAFDLLAGIIAMRIDVAPPFSALFTL